MAFVKVKIPRTSQPQDTCGIDWSNSITKGLAAVYYGQDLALSATSFTPLVAMADGLGTSNNATYPAPVIPTTGVTIFGIGTYGAINNNTFLNLSTTSSTGIGFRNNSTSVRLLVYRTGSAVTAAVSSKTITAGQRIVLAGTHDGAVQRLYEDGVQTAELANTNPVAYGPTPLLKIGSSFATGSFSGTTPLIAYFDRVLSAAEIKSLSDNPWQIFEPEELTIWIPDDAGTGGSDNLTSKNITLGAATVSTATIGQIHALSKKDINLLATDVTSPIIYQVHQLNGKSLSTDAFTVSNPILSSASTIDDLIGKNVSLSSLTISNPAFSQVHALNAQSVNLSAVTITKPELTSASNTDNLIAKNIALEAVQLTKPSIEQIHVLTGLDVDLSGFTATNPTIGQVHVLTVQPITLYPASISKPDLSSSANTDNLSPKDIILGALAVSSPAITQIHALVSKSLVTSAVSVTRPLVGQIHGLTPKNISLGSWTISNPNLTSGVIVGVYPLPEQVLIGVTYGPTGTEYTGTLVVGTGATVYIEQILSEVVDDQIIVLLQDEVIQSNILSETT